MGNWVAFNPAPGEFNRTYASIMMEIVDRLERHGIYALIDLHQDGLSKQWCQWDGVPGWVLKKSVTQHQFPWPLKGEVGNRSKDFDCHLNYDTRLAEAVGQAYDDLYLNNHGAVIGYETMNEPFAGNVEADPLLFLPGVAGKRLMQMHEAVAAGIRKHDDRHVIFYEPVTWGMILQHSITGSGFDHVPGGPQYKNMSVLSWHYYCSSFVSPSDKAAKRKILCDKLLDPRVFDTVEYDVAKTGGALMMTEGLGTTEPEPEIRDIQDRLDSRIYSWISWNYATGAYWEPPASWQQDFARTYARAVAGSPVRMTFDRLSGAFDLCFQLDRLVTTPTEIFASQKYTYPNGMTINLTANVKAAQDGDLILVIKNDAVEEGDENACVSVRRRPSAIFV